jgi:hypothetical protein
MDAVGAFVAGPRGGRDQVVDLACRRAVTGLDRLSWAFYVQGVPYRATCSAG